MFQDISKDLISHLELCCLVRKPLFEIIGNYRTNISNMLTFQQQGIFSTHDFWNVILINWNIFRMKLVHYNEYLVSTVDNDGLVKKLCTADDIWSHTNDNLWVQIIKRFLRWSSLHNSYFVLKAGLFILKMSPGDILFISHTISIFVFPTECV